METLKELNKICQKPEYKTKGNWMVRNITRDMALPVSWLLLHANITANQVTLFSLVIAGAACLMFGAGVRGTMLGGAVLLQLWYLLDHVDGHIARYRGESSLTGVYFDYITHYIVHAAIFIGIGVGIATDDGGSTFLIMGFAAAFGVTFLNLVYDVMYKTYFFRLTKARVVTVRHDDIVADSMKTSSSHIGIRQLFSFAHKLCEVHVLMNIVTLLAVVAFFFSVNPWKIFIIAYSFLCTGVGLFKNVHFILSKTPDKRLKKMFEVKD
ncbi:MAG: CDP-alcohol phosphatidyltransferase family protein [Candidatus Aadella gelida]|nr:CDP-alcohol phosphatidyltransferase family protein [Candidatus Aadella gelida]